MMASINEFGFKVPILARSSGEVVDGHLRLKAARKLERRNCPSFCVTKWTMPSESLRLLVNRSADWPTGFRTRRRRDEELKT